MYLLASWLLFNHLNLKLLFLVDYLIRPFHHSSRLVFPAGFALQAYRGAQKPTPMEVMKSQAARLADNPTAQQVNPPKMEIPTVEGRRQGGRPHKLKPRDMNVLTPSGF